MEIKIKQIDANAMLNIWYAKQQERQKEKGMKSNESLSD